MENEHLTTKYIYEQTIEIYDKSPKYIELPSTTSTD